MSDLHDGASRSDGMLGFEPIREVGRLYGSFGGCVTSGTNPVVVGGNQFGPAEISGPEKCGQLGRQ